MNMDILAFFAFAAIAVIASLLVVGQGNPMHSVMLLIVSFGALAGLYVLLDAPFTAVTQIIVYAGAIMVLFLFVVMLLNVPREDPSPGGLPSMIGLAGMRLGAVLSVLLAVEILWALGRRIGVGSFNQGATTSVSSVALIGSGIFTRHAFAFEATSVLILVAMIGAVVLARREHV
jgi:NADH-quinone oxidoreductase subunit J